MVAGHVGLEEVSRATVDVVRSYDYGPDFAAVVLASIVCDPKFLAKYRPALSPDMFQQATQSFLVETVLELFDQYKIPPSREVIKDAVRRSVYRDRAEAVMMVDALEPVPDAGYVADRVLDWCRWTMIDNVIEGHPRHDPRAFALAVDRASRTGDALVGDYVTLDDDGDVDQIRRRQVATPWLWLNQRMNGGPELQDFVVFMSFINVGKTTVLINVAGKAVQAGERVVYFTFEDGERKIKRRFMQWIGRFNTEELVANYKHACDLRNALLEESNGGSLVIKKMSNRRSSVEDAMAFVRAQNEVGDRPVSVVISDYMDRFGMPGGASSKIDPRHRMREVAEDCKFLAAELDVVHYSATQVQRNRAGKDIVSIEHVGESLGKLEGCDAALGLGQTMEQERMNRLTLYTGKLRDAKKHEAHPLSFYPDVQRVTELGER